MASSKTQSIQERMCGRPECFFQLSSMENDLQEDHSHGGPDGVKPDLVDFAVVTPPDDGSAVSMDWDRADDDLDDNEVRLRFISSSGDLTGCVVRVRVRFPAMASGGVTLSGNPL